jgi:hypothetical protein
LEALVGRDGFTSLAWKNLESRGFAVFCAERMFLSGMTALKVTTGLLAVSARLDGLGQVKVDPVSQGSERSWLGVPFGVVFVLSTRVCLDPERGVILAPRKAAATASEPSKDARFEAVVVAFEGAMVDVGRRCVRLGRGVVAVALAPT